MVLGAVASTACAPSKPVDVIAEWRGTPVAGETCDSAHAAACVRAMAHWNNSIGGPPDTYYAYFSARVGGLVCARDRWPQATIDCLTSADAITPDRGHCIRAMTPEQRIALAGAILADIKERDLALAKEIGPRPDGPAWHELEQSHQTFFNGLPWLEHVPPIDPALAGGACITCRTAAMTLGAFTLPNWGRAKSDEIARDVAAACERGAFTAAELMCMTEPKPYQELRSCMAKPKLEALAKVLGRRVTTTFGLNVAIELADVPAQGRP